METAQPAGLRDHRTLSRKLSVAGCVIVSLAAGGACVSTDQRPVIQNFSSNILELQTQHADGRTLTSMLQPGTEIALGSLDAAVERIEGYRAGEQDPLWTVEDGDIQRCLSEARDRCLGWRLEDHGFAQLTDPTTTDDEAAPTSDTTPP